VRYCGTDDASTSAAIRDGVRTLDGYFRDNGVPLAAELIVIYRNRMQGSVTLEIGYPVNDKLAKNVSGEILSSWTPSGLAKSRMSKPGISAVLSAYDRFFRGNKRLSPPTCWQHFTQSEFRPWRHHPAAEVFTIVGDEPLSGQNVEVREYGAQEGFVK
jgi:hypothetical protein